MSAPPKAIFLSYASQDAQAARRICDVLRAVGLEVWFDQSAPRGGDAWDASIRRQIKECALFVPVISDNTQVREEGYFRLEWKLAVDRSHLMADDNTFLLPVVIDSAIDVNARVLEKFREVQWTHLPGGGEASAAFAQRVQRLLSGGTAPAPPVAPLRVALAASAVLVGGTSKVATMAGLQFARERVPADPAPLLARMAAVFATGQVAGPAVVRLPAVQRLAGRDAMTITTSVATLLPAVTSIWLWREDDHAGG